MKWIQPSITFFASLWRGLFIVFILNTCMSCNDFLDANLSKSLITTDNIFSNEATATAAVTGMYNSIMNSSPMSGTSSGMNSLTGLSSGELFNYPHTTDLQPFTEHNVAATNSSIEALWNFAYNIIYQANVIIAGLQDAHALSRNMSQQLEGEARFMRAFTYFYMINLFGDVPLVTEIDYHKNQLLPRTPVDKVYAFVENDLLIAQALLTHQYVTSNRTRPNKATATALLARMYLYRKDYQQAEILASAVINDTTYVLSEDLEKTFLANSAETIWQLMPVDPYYNTIEGYYFILTGTPSFNTLTPGLPLRFEPGDARLTHWVRHYTNSSGTFYFPYKYKKGGKLPTEEFSEYSVVFRLAEMYLIRAEARANLDNVSGARADLNIVRNRADLKDTSASDQHSLLQAVEDERLSELFTEYGHHWLDLKRTGRALSVLGGDITADDLLYPIPFAEFQKNPNLGLQNDGY